MSDDTDATIHVLPRRSDDAEAGEFVMPDAPLEAFELPTGEPEFLDEVVVPAVPEPMSPHEALTASAMPAPADEDVEEDPVDGEDGEPSGPRPGVLERIADWIDYRIRLGDARHQAQAPLREAEIAAKVGQIQARTAQEAALAEQNGKLSQALLAAKGARAAAKGKADADRIAAQSKAAGAGPVKAAGPVKSSGVGADKGGHHKPRRDDQAKAREKAAAVKANEDKRRAQDKASRDADKARAREQRKADKAAGQKERGGGQWAKALDDRRARKAADRKADRKSNDKAVDHLRKEEADQAAHLRREKERDADHRRKEDAKDADLKREKKRRGLDKDGPDAEKDDAEKRAPDAEKDALDGDSEKDPGKESAPDAEKGPDGASDTPDGKPEGDESDASPEGAEGPSDGPESAEGAEDAKTAGEQEDGEEFWRDLFDDFARRFRKKDAEDTDAGPDAETPPGPIRAEDAGITVERADRPDPTGEAGEPAAIAPGPLGLPAASEPRTERPGTSRPVQEEQVSSPSSRGGGQPRMAARHQASITVYQYADNMARIDDQAGQDRDVADKLNEALAKIGRELRVWAADLVLDDNIDTETTDKIISLADDSAEMAVATERFAQGCWKAAEYAFTAREWVEQVYGEDIEAMKAGGLKQASAAGHH